jgi:hypothetical protein
MQLKRRALVEKNNVRVAKCPIGQQYCTISCYFRNGDRCYFKSERGKQIAELKKKMA